MYLRQFSRLFILFLWASGFSGFTQNCPTLLTPRANSFNVPVDVTLSWTTPSSEFSTFVLSMGTSPGGINLVNRRTSGIISSFKPELGLPEDSDIYVNIILIRSDQTSIQCNYTFSTKIIEEVPECTSLSVPVNLATSVPNNSDISWNYAARATGYRISMGTTPGGTDLSNNQDWDVGNQLSFNPLGNLPSDQLIYVRITPYNRIGDAVGCSLESFTTGNTNIDCEPQKPKITSIPSLVGLCKQRGFTDLRVIENADAYEWFQLDARGQELPIGTGDSLRIAETGIYRLVASNRVGSPSDYTVCETVRDFEVIEVGIPQISNIRAERDAQGLNIQIETDAAINYQYALNEDGPFQESPFFSRLPVQPYTVYIRDPFGCEITSRPVARKLSPSDFPAFFTPNGDGINEIWKYNPPADLPDAFLEYINIFDRYGNLISRIAPEIGWNGQHLSGKPMISSVYWFEAVSLTGEAVRGYFALKRSRD